jgi:hypothetical protein
VTAAGGGGGSVTGGVTGCFTGSGADTDTVVCPTPTVTPTAPRQRAPMWRTGRAVRGSTAQYAAAIPVRLASSAARPCGSAESCAAAGLCWGSNRPAASAGTGRVFHAHAIAASSRSHMPAIRA